MTHQFPHKCSPQYSTIQDFSTFPSGASDGHSSRTSCLSQLLHLPILDVTNSQINFSHYEW